MARGSNTVYWLVLSPWSSAKSEGAVLKLRISKRSEIVF